MCRKVCTPSRLLADDAVVRPRHEEGPLCFGFGSCCLPLASFVLVESRMGAVAWGHWPTPRFPSPLIEPDLQIYRIRLSDWLPPRPTAGQVGAGVLGTALRGSDGSHRM